MWFSYSTCMKFKLYQAFFLLTLLGCRNIKVSSNLGNQKSNVGFDMESLTDRSLVRVTGVVIDSLSSEWLTYPMVILVDTAMGVVGDSIGQIEIVVPVEFLRNGRVAVTVEAMGYYDKIHYLGATPNQKLAVRKKPTKVIKTRIYNGH
jgi:hypothetical protein